MTPEEQQQEIKNLIAYYEERGWDWIDIVGYHCAKYTGRWPPPKPERKNVGRPRGKTDQLSGIRRSEERNNHDCAANHRQ